MSEEKLGQTRLFGDLAWLWPVISPPAGYLAEADEIATLLRRYARREIHRVLDLGCGGGHVDFGLKRHFSIVGIDLSEAMLTLARKLNPEVTYLNGDLRSPPTGELFDAVYLGDAVNHMLTEADLRRAFQAAYDSLQPGGVFLTVAEVTRESFASPHTEVTHHGDEGVQVTLVQDMYDPSSDDTTYDLTLLFLIRRGKEVQIEVDRYLCGLFPLNTWQETLVAVGFEAVMLTLDTAACPAMVGVKKSLRDCRP